MSKKRIPLSKDERKKIVSLYRSAVFNSWLGLIIAMAGGYFIFNVVGEIQKVLNAPRYNIYGNEDLNLLLTVLFLGVLVFSMLMFSLFAFFFMFVAYRIKAKGFKKDRRLLMKEVIRGKVVSVGGRRQGFHFYFESGEEAAIDFEFLVTAGYSIVDASVLVPVNVEIETLPYSHISLGMRYLDYPEQRYPSDDHIYISGTITLAFTFEVGTKAKYKGIVPLDRRQLMVQIGNQPIMLPEAKLPTPGTYAQHVIDKNSKTNL